MAKTLLLDRSQWDLVLDAAGNMAVADAPYATAQDIASNQRTLRGECWYNTGLGIPYLDSVLGQAPPRALLQHYLEDAAKQVPLVVNARTQFTTFTDGRVGGTTESTLADGDTVTTNS